MTARPSPDAPGALNWALVTSLGAIWGGAFMGMSLALEGFGPLTVAAGRTLVGALALAALAAALGQGPGATIRRGGAAGAAMLALLGATSIAVPFALLAWGLQHIPSAFAGVAMGSVPLMLLPLVAIFSPEEGIGPRRVAGVALGFVGLVLLVTGGEGGAVRPAPLEGWGRAACLGAAFCYAASSVLIRRAPPMPPIGFGAGVLIAGSILLVPLALVHEGWPADWPAGPTLALVLTGLLPTGLATAMRVRVITTAGSLFMSLVAYMVPVWAVILGVGLMGEDLPPSLYSGAALILAGIALAQSRAILAVLNRRAG